MSKGGATIRLRADAAAWREIDGQIVLADFASQRVFRLSSSATPIWSQLASGVTEEELVASLITRYGLDRELACSEVDTFLRSCESRGLVEKDEGDIDQIEALHVIVLRLRDALCRNDEDGADTTALADTWVEAASVSRRTHELLAEARIAAAEGGTSRPATDRHALVNAVIQVQELLARMGATWASLTPEFAQATLAHPRLASHAVYLRRISAGRRHFLSADAEAAIARKDRHGRTAWRRMYYQDLEASTVSVNGAELTLHEARSALEDPRDRVRRPTAAAISVTLRRCSHHGLRALEAIVADKCLEDDLRKHPDWLSPVRLNAGIDSGFIPALLGAVGERYSIVRRYWRAKARALNVDRLVYDADRLVPLGRWPALVPQGEAREIVVAGVTAFSSLLGDVAASLFDGGAVNITTAPHRMAYGCTIPVPGRAPRIIVQFSGALSSLVTVAHEVGHGVQAYLSRDNWGLERTELPKAFDDTPGLLVELAVMSHLASEQQSPQARLAVLGAVLDSTVSMVFRHVAAMHFEAALHAAWRDQGELTVDRVSGMWLDSLQTMAGDSVELTPDASLEWIAVPHAMGDPGGAWTHASSCLLSRALFDYRQVNGPDYAERIVTLLGSGGTLDPAGTLALIGMELPSRPRDWVASLDAVEAMVGEVEELVG